MHDKREHCLEGGEVLAVQLFCHSDYSLLEAPIIISELVEHAHKLGFTAIGLTDHNTTAGHVELTRACKVHGLTPLYGLELDVSHSGLSSDRIVLFAKNRSGYHNLQRLASASAPVDSSLLSQCAEDLIMLTGGPHSALSELVEAGREEEALRLAEWYSQVFELDWYVQIVWDTPAQKETAYRLASMFGQERCAAGQAVYYLTDDDKLLYRALSAVRENVSLDQVEVHSKAMLSADALASEFADFPLSLENAQRIAAECSFSLPRQTALPKLPEEVNWRKAVLSGAQQRYGTLSETVQRRIEHEMNVIEEMGLADYFLIVADIVSFAKRQGIPVGPGRGSAASSAVAYCLGITDVDPVKYGLIFERFLNKDRHNLPDIDLDFCYERRGEVLKYVQERYGPEHVALIGTYGSFGERNAESLLRQAAGNRLSEAQLRHLTKKMARLKRHFSTHASGVVISSEPIVYYQAVRSEREMAVTHGDMHALEWQGLLKIDFLGLRTLTFLKSAESEVKQSDPTFDLENIPLDDKKTLELLSSGCSVGIFQLESSLFQDLLRQMRPRSFLELASLLALGRPGPLSMVPQYLENRANPGSIKYAHPAMREILSETYGLAIYQEQVIQLGHRLGKLSMSQADLLRIAISKKDGELIKRLAPEFLQGCRENGLSSQEAQRLFASIQRFAGYAFNKAHSVSYALLSWRAAYLKAHYPQVFFTALMEGHSGESLRPYILECRRLGIPIYPPDVQLSDAGHVAEDKGIRLGLSAIKHVGTHGAQVIVDAHRMVPFRNLMDFRRRVNLPSQTITALSHAGALDSVPGNRDLLSPLAKLKAERELLGAYISDHPATRFMTFLRQISGGLAFAAGEVSRLREKDGLVIGELDDPDGLVDFVLPRKNFQLKKGDLTAVFGSWKDEILHGQWMFPLGPTLILIPNDEALLELQQILVHHSGNIPVVLRLGREVLHILPRKYWVNLDRTLTIELERCCRAVQVFDPWHQQAELRD